MLAFLFIDGSKGTTKYYEYGRYNDPKGRTRKIKINDVKLNRTGHPTLATLSYSLSQISARSGQGGAISGAYIEVPGKYQLMLQYCLNRMRLNSVSSRKQYDLWSYSCNHFMQGVLVAAGVNVPSMIDPRPTSYIDEIRSDHRDLDYNPRAAKGVIIESTSDNVGWFDNFLGQLASL